MKRQYRVSVTVNKKLYEYLQEKSKTELRSAASIAKYYLAKGLEAEGVQDVEELIQ